MDQIYWRKCGSCRKEIGFNCLYQTCSVSTCRALAFCSVDCWDQHNPVMNHKNAWAEERRSPPVAESVVPGQETTRRIIAGVRPSVVEQEILIVASKLKQYIKDKYEMNTSANVMEILSHKVRSITDRAVERAKQEGRKTLMDRDFD